MTSVIKVVLGVAVIALPSIFIKRHLQTTLQPTSPVVSSIPAPPKGFNPLTATDAQLAKYGLPPRPTPVGSPQYKAWAQAVTAAKTPITPVFHEVKGVSDPPPPQ
ncbi:hypothetical protein [Sulfobacillus thermosulfidooxidans]|uniref:hypothetical protein n=1 Tax=Sulfobacillus thermosulfidooxidans TaxID=28034 RepID=UPI0006B57649|nr:hypothetical protein [Sulfobacillus thermosulfidooxidans]